MPILSKTLKTLGASTLLTGVFIYQRTKHSQFIPLAPDDAILSSPILKANNPLGNRELRDLCVRRVPIGRVKPRLVDAFLQAQEELKARKDGKGEEKGDGVKAMDGKVEETGNSWWNFGGAFTSGAKKIEDGVDKVVEVVAGNTEAEAEGEEYALIEQFCAGVWSGLGYQPQRQLLASKYQHLPDRTDSPSQLWTRSELKTSTYPIGTQITDHFEVVSKTWNSIIVRCGDSPLNKGLRDSDGLFEMGVRVIPAEGLGGLWGAGKGGEVEFSLKSIFFKGLTPSTEPPMPLHIEYLHRLYTKIWMETAIYNVMV